MKRMFQLLIILFLIYFGIEFIYNFLGDGHDVNYTLNINNVEIKIHEILSLNGEEADNYFLDITKGEVSIPFKIYNTYSKRQKIVKNVTFFEDNNNVCAYVELKEEETNSNIKCIRNGIAYDYIDFKGKSSKIDSMIDELKIDFSRFQSDKSKTITKFSNMSVYPNDFPKNMYMILENYRGVYLLGSEVNNYIRTIQFFNQDVYNPVLSAVVGKYYVVANYNANHEFHEFHLLNLVVGDTTKFKFDSYISFNSFVQGVHDNKLYIVDKDNKVQYVVDPYKKTVNVNTDINNMAEVYKNGKREAVNVNEIIDKKIVFTNEFSEYGGKTYSRVLLDGTDKSGTYYLFEKSGDKYDVYLVYTGSEVKTYAFTTSSKDTIQISNSYVYYLDEDVVMVYSPSFGKKEVLKNTELKYNSDLKFLVY